MKKTSFVSLSSLAVTLLLHASLISVARGDVTIHFSEIGGNVVATTTGSFAVPLSATEPAEITFGTTHDVNGGQSWFYNIDGDYISWSGGSPTASWLNERPTLAEGDTFGFTSFGPTYLPTDVLGNTFTPETTWIWENTTLAGIGFDGLTEGPLLVHTTAWGEHIYFAIPEPATQALLLGGAAALLAVMHAKRRGQKEVP